MSGTVGRLCRQADRTNAGAFGQPLKGGAERRVPVHKEIPPPPQKPAESIGKIASDLQHPRGGGMRRDPGASNSPICEIHHEQNVVGHQSTFGPDLHRREVDRRQGRAMCFDERSPCVQRRRLGAGLRPCSLNRLAIAVQLIRCPKFASRSRTLR